MYELFANNEIWPTPLSFGVGLFTDFRLYWEALHVAAINSSFSIEDLIDELPHRVKEINCKMVG